MPREVKTNIPPEMVHDALLETFDKWINFAMGEMMIGGKSLKNPSGRYASALRAELNDDGYIVALFMDEDELGDMDRFPMSGHRRFSLKDRMLRPGAPGVKRSKEGYLYRYIPIASANTSPAGAFRSSKIKNFLTTRTTGEFKSLGVNRNLTRMWLANQKKAHKSPGNKIVTMSNKPGSAKWIIPALPAFNVRKLLMDMTPKNIRDRIII